MNNDTKTNDNSLVLVEENDISLSEEKRFKELGFQILTETDVIVNLRFLGNISEGEKLMISDGKRLVVDQRYFQSFRRGWSGDSRQKVIEFIKYIKDCAKEICKMKLDKITSNIDKEINVKGLIGIQKLLSAACHGIDNLSMTYKDDKTNTAQISTIKDEIDTFCAEHLTSAVV
jgi:hypothetical protein